MTSEVTLFSSGALARDVRRSSRALSRIEADGVLRQTAVDVETDVAIAKLDSQTTATGIGLAAIGRVAQAQTAIEQLAPQASARLNLLADQHGLAMAAELDRLHQRLRRLCCRCRRSTSAGRRPPGRSGCRAHVGRCAARHRPW